MPNPTPSPSLILATLALAVYFVGAVEFMLAPMLTPLASAFAAKPADIAWLVSAYAVSYAVLAPLIGLLSDRIGRRRLLLPALALFAADALAVAFAPSLSFAIVARVLGGAAGAALTPTAFALISETVPEDRQAGAMGLVLFGLTLGIATGPTVAGLLTDAYDWRAPFIAVACGCIAVLIVGARILPPSIARQSRPLKASAARLLDGAILRPNLSKGLWLGATIAGYLISGEVLRSRYGLSTGVIGLSVAAFGFGLAAGNLAVGRLTAWAGRPETVLVFAIGLIFFTQSAFLATESSRVSAIILLALWGFASGLAAPANTAVQASRAGSDAGFVLASSESMNNGALLVLAPVVASWIGRADTVNAAILLGACTFAALGVNLLDRQSLPKILPGETA
ncbi:MFS transporter [Methylosinus sp. C49]|uniref:MFS transporter n=1 Tax=Methylosinus sp. C49 TaxID=2699395 RepID=UPI001366D4CC|nr:MFS transporter [Methylosinus sp. C49]BBU61700.1 MFS transporter [Methylosinus sp. C49]